MAGNNSNAKAVRTSKTTPKISGVKFDGKGMSLGMFLACFACLAAGVLLGGFGFHVLTKNDCFEMVAVAGEDVDITIGGDENPTEYHELGAKCVSFGKDLSNEVKIKYLYREDITQDTREVDMIDPTVAGIYYVVYTSTNFKYKKVQLVRNVNVIVPRVEDWHGA